MINRILIVGYGSIGKRHLRIARELMPLADIRILRHKDTNEIPEYADGIFSAIEEAIFFAPQLAVISNPAPFHITSSQALAEAGVHLLIEKPLSSSLDGVENLIEICKERRVILMTGYNLRFMPSLQFFKEALDKGVVGKVLSVRCEVGQYLPSWRSGVDYRGGVSARKGLGGGALLELSHELDYLRWIFGEIKWVKATLSRQSGLDIDVEDTAALTLGFMPTLEGFQLISAVNLDFIRHDTTRLCTAIGEKGSLRWNYLTGEVMLYEMGASDWKKLYGDKGQRDASYVSEWQEFLRCISEDTLPLVTGYDGLEVLRIVEASRRSSKFDGLKFELAELER